MLPLCLSGFRLVQRIFAKDCVNNLLFPLNGLLNMETLKLT